MYPDPHGNDNGYFGFPTVDTNPQDFGWTGLVVLLAMIAIVVIVQLAKDHR